MTLYGTTTTPKTADELAEWTPITGFNRYVISRDGRVFDQERERFVALCPKQVNSTKHYVMLSLKSDEGTRKTLYLHRLLGASFLPNPYELPQIDHLNGNSLDNRLSNLRWASASQNNQNRRVSASGTSAYMGVSWQSNSQTWRASITREGKLKNLGNYRDELDAARAYDAAALADHIMHHNGLIQPKNN